ncbi:MAG: biotin/lipoyl-containing protein [Syntrophobacter sp.]
MRRYKIQVKGKEYVVYVNEITASRFRVVLDDKVAEVELLEDQDLAEATITPGIIPLRAEEEGVVERPVASYNPPPAEAFGYAPKSPSPVLPPRPSLPSDGPRRQITSPMPGVIRDIQVKPGDKVETGQALLVLEAMKMKNAIRSPRGGTIANVRVQSGQCVSYGDVLVEFEQEEQP